MKYEKGEDLPNLADINYIALTNAFQNNKEFINSIFEGVLKAAHAGKFHYNLELSYTDERKIEQYSDAFRNIFERLGFFHSNYYENNKMIFYVAWESNTISERLSE